MYSGGGARGDGSRVTRTGPASNFGYMCVARRFLPSAGEPIPPAAFAGTPRFPPPDAGMGGCNAARKPAGNPLIVGRLVMEITPWECYARHA